MKILVTGGAGYIGSHTCVELLQRGHEVLVFDSLVSGSMSTLERVEMIAQKRLEFVHGDIRNTEHLTQTIMSFSPEAVIHFAGLKSVNESALAPISYYETNVWGTMSLLKAMEEAQCDRIVFSSTASIYGEAQYLPYDENHMLSPSNPYGHSKRMSEQILRDWVFANEKSSVICLRYFNPVGAHKSGLIGENPSEVPNNLMPYLALVAAGQKDFVPIFGNDYSTRDGTGERDYIHVLDLAKAHVAALEHAERLERFEVMNVGTGRGTTVLELIHSFERISSKRIRYKFKPRRIGDVGRSWANAARASALLDLKAEHSIDEMCADTWRWQKMHLNRSCHP